MPDGLSAIEAASRTTSDLCLLDLQMPCASEATLRIAQQVPSAGIVMITASPTEFGLEEAIRVGAHGYIEPRRFAPALRAVCSGDVPENLALVRDVLFPRLAY